MSWLQIRMMLADAPGLTKKKKEKILLDDADLISLLGGKKKK